MIELGGGPAVHCTGNLFSQTLHDFGSPFPLCFSFSWKRHVTVRT